MNEVLPASVSVIPICWRAEAAKRNIPQTIPPISSFFDMSIGLLFEPKSLRSPLESLSKITVIGISANIAIILRENNSVNAGIELAAFCATNAKPQITAAKSSMRVDTYFFIVYSSLIF